MKPNHEPLEKATFLHTVRNGDVDAEMVADAINDVAKILNAAISRINELEARYEKHRHDAAEMLGETQLTTPPIEETS